jgi:hypothetical protein
MCRDAIEKSNTQTHTRTRAPNLKLSSPSSWPSLAASNKKKDPYPLLTVVCSYIYTYKYTEREDYYVTRPIAHKLLDINPQKKVNMCSSGAYLQCDIIVLIFAWRFNRKKKKSFRKLF